MRVSHKNIYLVLKFKSFSSDDRFLFDIVIVIAGLDVDEVGMGRFKII